jgi:dipeptidyl aminopeptidase/acylaminoacyl peptidase
VGSEKGVYDPKFSPRGDAIAFVRSGNLFVVDLVGRERQLTTDGEGTVQNGVAEFVAQEEMGRSTGYWWSPDGRYIAYTQIDEVTVSCVQRPAYYADRVEVVEQRYPAAGENNALVRVGVLDVETGETVWMDTGQERDVYMADDNVLFQHSVLLMDVLQKASIPFEMMAYPGKKHGIAGKPIRTHLFGMILAHFRRYLAGEQARAKGPLREVAGLRVS